MTKTGGYMTQHKLSILAPSVPVLVMDTWRSTSDAKCRSPYAVKSLLRRFTHVRVVLAASAPATVATASQDEVRHTYAPMGGCSTHTGRKASISDVVCSQVDGGEHFVAVQAGSNGCGARIMDAACVEVELQQLHGHSRRWDTRTHTRGGSATSAYIPTSFSQRSSRWRLRRHRR